MTMKITVKHLHYLDETAIAIAIVTFLAIIVFINYCRDKIIKQLFNLTKSEILDIFFIAFMVIFLVIIYSPRNEDIMIKVLLLLNWSIICNECNQH